MTTIQDIIGEICISGPQGFQIWSPNALADRFRQGEDLRDLAPMLTHSDPQIASAGAWIASEVVDTTRGRTIFDELARLLSHPDPAVRFWPISSVAQLARPSDTTAIHRLVSLIADKNMGVRQQALRYVCLIRSSTLVGLQGTASSQAARLLLSEVSKTTLLAEGRSKNVLQRRAAIAGAIRNHRSDVGLIEELESSLNAEERNELAELREQLGPLR